MLFVFNLNCNKRTAQFTMQSFKPFFSSRALRGLWANWDPSSLHTPATKSRGTVLFLPIIHRARWLADFTKRAMSSAAKLLPPAGKREAARCVGGGFAMVTAG
ncbi:hypothetical protein CDAR_295951 [Caerostris darwini]|uniref:Uncharacterized protein n=1 Tax=Caerostris darwini TaxID=1538125 RepID=A0AAV4SSP4_9ARAC|nr:hypothetical protein CDAR_295951 [Caerostris darwini]